MLVLQCGMCYSLLMYTSEDEKSQRSNLAEILWLNSQQLQSLMCRLLFRKEAERQVWSGYTAQVEDNCSRRHQDFRPAEDAVLDAFRGRYIDASFQSWSLYWVFIWTQCMLGAKKERRISPASLLGNACHLKRDSDKDTFKIKLITTNYINFIIIQNASNIKS